MSGKSRLDFMSGGFLLFYSLNLSFIAGIPINLQQERHKFGDPDSFR